ncbi:Peflin [Ceratobasidium theobromae]|uniref:Peflin n=1 Tax=Ceratobasidium theobromae TaxID=1582974 RepID=A0A5N5QVN1_9AGAM|nr:Peflin [Ceratobasidium theobromae]
MSQRYSYQPSNQGYSQYHQQAPPQHPQQQYRQSTRPMGGPAGFVGGGPSPRPPPGADPQLWSWFVTVDEDRSGQITATELQRALVNGNWSPFDLDTTKMLMGIFDVDHSGSISFNEFAGLWKYIADWQNVFRHFDSDNSGTIEANELANALRQFGYNLSPQLINLVATKYSALPLSNVPGAPAPGISFDRFVRACVAIKTLTEAFQRLDTDRDGWIQINYDTFLSTMLSAP